MGDGDIPGAVGGEVFAKFLAVNLLLIDDRPPAPTVDPSVDLGVTGGGASAVGFRLLLRDTTAG